jgi:uracil phosphoribosyltransferase
MPLGALDKKRLAELRDRNLSTKLFRDNMHQLGAQLYAYTLTTCRVPLDSMYAVAVMRAGWGLVVGAMQNNYDGEIGLIDARRNEETLKSVINVYKCRDDLSSATVMVFETMLATGGSLANSINILKERSRPRHIIAVNLLCVPEGLSRMTRLHPDVDIVTACIDEGLDDRGYIVPGLGDAGDRYFGSIA